VERQALLERSNALQRCHSIAELLEMKVLTSQRAWPQGAH
jgi:hypothetical protein